MPYRTIVRSEARRSLDRLRQWLCRQAAAGCSRSERPVAVVQNDRFDATASVPICAFTTDATEAPLFRLDIEPDDRNGLRLTSRLMVDKITTVPGSRLGECIGRLPAPELVRLNRAITVFLGLA